MAATCPTGFDVDSLRSQVQATYEQVAQSPKGDFHFHRGPEYATRYLRYDAEALTALPDTCKARFAGVGNPHLIGPIHPGETVLDHACGAGTDLLLAARRVGATGRAIGVDMTPAMVECARQAAGEAGLADVVEVYQGFYEELPVPDASVDVLISNGVVNLAPDKRRVFAEIARVLKPGGRLYMADVVVARELTLEARNNPTLWAACIAGALPEPEISEIAAEVGLHEGRITEHFDCFRDTTAEDKVSKDLHVQGANFYAVKK